MEKEEELAKARGLAYAHSPVVASADGIDAKGVRAAVEVLHNLPQPVFVHCASGGRATAVVLTHNHVYSGSPATYDELQSIAASHGLVFAPTWQNNLKEEFFKA